MVTPAALAIRGAGATHWHLPWTDRERDTLRVYFGIESDAEVGRRLGRSQWGVRMEAWRLGLKRRDNFVLMPEVLSAFGITRNTLKRWMRNGWLAAYKTRIRQGKHRLWGFYAHSLLLFVETYSWVYELAKMQPEHWLTAVATEVQQREQWLTSAEVATRLHVARNTVVAYAQRGYAPFQLRPSRHGGAGGHVLVLRAADISLLKANMVDLNRQGQRPCRRPQAVAP